MKSNGIILWTLGAAGTLLVYSAFKNVKPQSVLMHYFTGAAYSTADAIQPGKAVNQPPSGIGAPTIPLPKGNGYLDYNNLGQADYNTSGNAPSTIPAAYRTSPATYIPAKAMTA